MEDNFSQSSESIATSEEYEILSPSDPELWITSSGRVDPLKSSPQKYSCNTKSSPVKKNFSSCRTTESYKQWNDPLQSSAVENYDRQLTKPLVSGMGQKNGTTSSKSQISDEIDKLPMELEITTVKDTSISTVHTGDHLSRSASDKGQNLFKKVAYLGCATIDAPRSEVEIQRNIAILNEQSSNQAVEINLSVPVHSEGTVILFEPDTNGEISNFGIHQILFCAQGYKDTTESNCFAFTCHHGDESKTAVFQCHIFKCDSSETIEKILQCFATVFCQAPKNLSGHGHSNCSENILAVETSVKSNEQIYIFEAFLDVKEDDSKGSFTVCPKDKDYFKLRCNVLKMINMSIQQVSNNKELNIEKCFGLLISPGRNVNHSDMQLIEMASMTKNLNGEKIMYHFSGKWNPNYPLFEVLNTETPRDTTVYLTVAVDVVIMGIQEPVRFLMETKAKIFAQNERFWYFSKKPFHEQLYLKLRQVSEQKP
ncbi:rab GTPase-activating protein 1-like [Limulus polyphemus]|uniref:Rab GTPase-activating protein 1-like n=1 Tax=Limulus polyphemus TaxID=6850 RepID=A0ABM1TNF0_LIMPO|nr:rab GTPase-activating protein 1-like [Limulus polyphemus]